MIVGEIGPPASVATSPSTTIANAASEPYLQQQLASSAMTPPRSAGNRGGWETGRCVERGR